MFRLSLSDLEEKDTYNEHWNLTHRQMLQQTGVGLRQSLGEDIWIRAANLLELEQHYEHVVVTDLRFKNEFDFIKKHDGYCVKICRETHSVDAHVSEHDLDDANWDAVIENNGTLSELYSTVDAMMVNNFGCVPND